MKQYCQTSLSEILRSSSNQVLLHFHTDRYSSDSSFQLHYAVEPGLPHCGGLFTEPKGFILGPSQQATCLYLIQQPIGTQIKWEFLDFQTFENINCELNRIEVSKLIGISIQRTLKPFKLLLFFLDIRWQKR